MSKSLASGGLSETERPSPVIPGSSAKFMSLQRRPPDVMYHYTSAEALENILITRRMWATDLRTMNDPQELLYARGLINQRIRAASRRFRNPLRTKFLRTVQEQFQSLLADGSSSFSVSFSERVDLPHQWRDYAEDGNGFAIGWHMWSPCPENPLRMWVTYDRAQQRTLVDSLINFHIDHISRATADNKLDPKTAWTESGLSLGMFFDVVLQTFKHKKWSKESEFRYVYQFFHGYEPPGQIFRSRFANGVEKRYIEADFSGVQLREIVVGPCNDFSHTTVWLRDLLNKTGFDAVKITPAVVSTEDIDGARSEAT